MQRRSAPPEPWICEQLFDQHQELLAPLVAFLTQRARLPRASELPEATSVIRSFGSLARAFAIISTTTGTQHWEDLRERATADLLIYLALARFDGRPRYKHLPQALQHDVREFTRSYKVARERADRLLLASGNRDMIALAVSASPVGKQTPSALYVHTDALAYTPPVLRVPEGCARTLVGTVPGANIIKLHRDQPLVTYLSYPDFSHDPHPSMTTATVVDLRSRSVDVHDYRRSSNPPLLHRTEEFLAADDPRREPLAKISKTEVEAGLYEHPDRIGTRLDWLGELQRCLGPESNAVADRRVLPEV